MTVRSSSAKRNIPISICCLYSTRQHLTKTKATELVAQYFELGVAATNIKIDSLVDNDAKRLSYSP